MQTSICGLGQVVPMPIRSVLTHFRDEVDEHLLRQRCPAGVCTMRAREPGDDGEAHDRRPRGHGTSGTTIFDAARRLNGIDIPTLCHAQHQTPVGVCRVCMVE